MYSLVLYMSFDRFLLAVESCDLSQAYKYYKSVFFFNSIKLQFLNDETYNYTKNTYLAFGNLAKLMVWSTLFARLKNEQFSQFFW